MPDIQNMYSLILEMNKLKLVFRNTTTNPFIFSKTFTALYQQLKIDLLKERLISE